MDGYRGSRNLEGFEGSRALQGFERLDSGKGAVVRNCNGLHDRDWSPLSSQPGASLGGGALDTAAVGRGSSAE